MGYFEIILIVVCIFLFTALFLVMRSDKSHSELTQRLVQLRVSAGQLYQSHAELSGRVLQSQSAMNDQLEALSKRLGEGLAQQTEKTGKTLKELHERLVVIDSAQQKITNLSQQVVGLQDILSNK